MMKKDYVCPDAKVVKIDSYCMLGNESGEGEGASLDLDFDETPEETDLIQE